MAAPGNAHKANIFYVAVERHFPKHLENDGAVKAIEGHALLNFVQALGHFCPLAHMAAVFKILLAVGVEGVGRVDVDIRIVLGYGGQAKVVVHVLVRLDHGGNFIVCQHGVDAFALVAGVHPQVIPAGVKKVFCHLAVHGFNFNKA